MIGKAMEDAKALESIELEYQTEQRMDKVAKHHLNLQWERGYRPEECGLIEW